jgi:uncharacterized coiled-coil protein SlyX
MNRLTTSFAIACGAALFATTANAQTVDQLKRELAARKAYIAKLEQRLRDLEKRPPAPRPTLVTAPVVAAPPPGRVAVAAPPPSPEDDEMERALERTLVREGALVLPPWTYEVTPQFSYAHWDSIQDPFIRNSYSAGLSFRMGLPWTSQAGKSWGKFSSMGVGRGGVDCGRAVHLAEARGAITARQVALTLIDDRIVAGATIIDERRARGHSVHLSIGHLSGRDGWSLGLVVLLEVLAHSRSRRGCKDG